MIYNNIGDSMKKNKKIIIGIIVLLIVGIGVYYVYRQNELTFSLNGDEKIIVNYGSKYDDPGYIASNGFKRDLSGEVETIGEVDTLKPGTYEINYKLNHQGKVLELKRTVIVNEIQASDLEIVLNGDSEIYIIKGDKYDEVGAYVLDKVTNIKYENNNVIIEGNVDTNKEGTYELVYAYKYNGEEINKTRKIIVFDVENSIEPKTMVSDKAKISLNFDKIDNYVSVIMPNKETSTNKNVEYEVTSNGDYIFTIALSNGKEYTKKITVNNIIGTYTCSGTITVTGTKITVSPSNSNIKEYEWIINNNLEKGSNIYQKEKIISAASVNLVFDDNQKYEVKCNIEDKLIYHFKYDENNSKPFMKCNTYTAEDRVKLEGMLKQAVEEAGYGTRAGVVAAARFLVGALDYKVPYLGPKKVDSSLGRYQKVGLNIGKTGAWGCNVSGYVQGMDCTNFVRWAFAQNGIESDAYKSNHKAVRDVINDIKVGDLLYTPCEGSNCKNEVKLDHVGIIIGIDANYVYVAESTTGNINAIVVTKLEKNNMPSKGKFSRVYLATLYNGDGNLTNMWMSE